VSLIQWLCLAGVLYSLFVLAWVLRIAWRIGEADRDIRRHAARIRKELRR